MTPAAETNGPAVKIRRIVRRHRTRNVRSRHAQSGSAADVPSVPTLPRCSGDRRCRYARLDRAFYRLSDSGASPEIFFFFFFLFFFFCGFFFFFFYFFSNPVHLLHIEGIRHQQRDDFLILDDDDLLCAACPLSAT